MDRFAKMDRFPILQRKEDWVTISFTKDLFNLNSFCLRQKLFHAIVGILMTIYYSHLNCYGSNRFSGNLPTTTRES